MLEKAGDGLKGNENKVDVLCDVFSVSRDALYKTGGLNPNANQIKPKVQDLQKKRFEKVVKYYFPGDSAKFILG